MKRRIQAAVLAALVLAGAGAFGQDGKTETDRFRESLSRQGAVTDEAGVFTPEQKTALEERLVAFQKEKGSALVVVALKSLRGGEVDDFANKLFQQWGIGEKGKDNGVLLLAAIEDRKVRIEPGYGFEGALPDAKCGRILDEHVIPRFKEGNYAQGLSDGADILLKVMGGEELPAEAAQEGSALAGIVFLVIFAVIFILIVRAAIRGGKGGGRHGGSRRGSWSSGGSSGGWSSGGGGGGFGGFGGGSSGGGGASRGW